MKPKFTFPKLLMGCYALSIFAACGTRTKTNATRWVTDNNLISTTILENTFEVSKELQFLVDSAFVLKERSNTEVYFFADTKEGETQRFLQFQFENLRPGIEGPIKFDGVTDSLEIAGIPMLQRYWCFDMEEAAIEMPKSDIAVVQKMLASKGIATTGQYVGKMFIYLSDDRRSEALIIYGEKYSVRNIDCENEETAAPSMEEMDKDVLRTFEIQD